MDLDIDVVGALTRDSPRPCGEVVDVHATDRFVDPHPLLHGMRGTTMLQVHLSDRWQTFRTTRTDSSGHWSIPYRFKRTRGVQRYRFRLGLPPEASYPFAAGKSRSLVVRVRGL